MGIDPTDPHGLKHKPLDLHQEHPIGELKLDPKDKEKYEAAYAQAPGGTVNPPAPIVGKIPDVRELEVLYSPPKPAPDTSPEVRGSEPCTFEEFMKVDLRVGTIRSAERVPKSDKLLRLQVSFGSMGDRQILAGIGKTFEPSELVGHKSVFVVNLPPRKMMGLESHGMILATGAPEALTLLSIPSSAAVEGYRFG